MERRDLTFRVFVSSTFSDLVAERNVLQATTVPRLERYCRDRGSSFQAIDLRWGVSGEASLDQQAMNICLGEIRRCQRITPRPNFIILLGHRYGWMPPPPQVPGDVFERIRVVVNGEQRGRLDKWYRLDQNAVPPQHVLQPREGPYADQATWQPTEAVLQQALCAGARAIGLTGDDLLPFCASATHQEIAAGALRVAGPGDKVVCIFRELDVLAGADGVEDFIDADHGPIDALKGQLEGVVPQTNIVRCTARWSAVAHQPTPDHLSALADNVYETLRRQIDRELDTPTGAAPPEIWHIHSDEALDAEGRAQHDVAERHLTHFVGRDDILAQTAQYLAGDERRLLVVSGEGGMGKSALMAKVIEQAHTAHPQAQIVYRFIGATPVSSSGGLLLRNLCLELCRRYGGDEATVPQHTNELVRDFRERLASATASAPLILVFDALDQIPKDDTARRLAWLPFELPEHVRLIVSTRPVDTLKALQFRQPHVIELGGMKPWEAETLLDLWLKDVKRTLQPHQRAEVLDRFVESGSPPLYLRLAFEEARRWVSWKAQVPLIPAVEGIIRRNLFARLAYGHQHGSALVSRALGFLAASRYGLAEDEMRCVLSRDVVVYGAFLRGTFHLPPDIVACAEHVLRAQGGSDINAHTAAAWLDEVRRDEERLQGFLAEVLAGADRPQLPVVLWARLLSDLEPYLTRRAAEASPLLDFYHRELGDVSASEYLAPAARTLHGGLATYFREQDSWRAGEEGRRNSNGRKVSELPWQLLRAEQWDNLRVVLSDLDFLQAKCVAGESHDLRGDYLRAAAAWPRPIGPVGQVAEQTAWAAADPLDEILAWQAFLDVSAERLASREEPALQVALNWADGGPVAQAMEKRVAAAAGPTGPWLRLINRPPFVRHPVFQRSLEGHAAPIASLAIRGDGSRAISSSENGEVLFWDVNTGSSRLVLEESAAVAAATPDLGRLLTAANGTLELWDTATSARLLTIPGLGPIEELALTANANRALTVDRDGAISHWDLEKVRRLKVLLGHTKPVAAVAMTPAGNWAVSGGEDRMLRVWNVETGTCVKAMKGHTAAITAVAITPDGTLAVSGARDNRLRVWDLNRGECLSVLEGHTSSVLAVAVSHDGHRAVSGGWDQVLRVWQLPAGPSWPALKGHSQWIRAVALTPDGRLALSGGDDQTIRVWDLDRHREEQSPMSCDEVWKVAPVADRRRVISLSADRTLGVWDLETGTLVRRLSGHSDRISTVVPSPDGIRAISASYDHTVRVWNLHTGDCLHVLRGHEHWVFDVAITPDGHRAVSLSEDKTLRVWDVDHGRCLRTLAGHTEAVSAIAVTPDGRHAVSASFDKTLRVWDLVSGVCVKDLVGHTALVYGLALTPDGANAVSVGDDKTLRLWDLGSGDCLRVLAGHTGEIRSVTVTPDGRRALSSGSDGTRVWDLHSGLCKQPWPGSVGCVSPNSRFVAMLGGGDGLRLHDLHTMAGVGAYVSLSGGQGLRLWDLHTGAPVAAYVSPGGDVGAVSFAGSLLIAGTALGRVDLLTVEGVGGLTDPPRATLARLWQFAEEGHSERWDQMLTAACPSCMHRFTPDIGVIDAIRAIAQQNGLAEGQSPCLTLAGEAWDDPRLLVRCDHCEKPVWLNPFVSGSQYRPAAQAERSHAGGFDFA